MQRNLFPGHIIANQIKFEKSRPNASSGYWLCSLLPFAFVIRTFCNPYTGGTLPCITTTYLLIALFIKELFVFSLISVRSQILERLADSIPCFVLTLMYWLSGLLKVSLLTFPITKEMDFNHICFLMSISAIFVHDLTIHKIHSILPESFTVGESIVATQGFFITAISAGVHCNDQYNSTEMEMLTCILLRGLCFLFAIIVSWIRFNDVPLVKLLSFIFNTTLAAMMPISGNIPIVIVLKFISQDLGKLGMLLFFLGSIGLVVATVIWHLNSSHEVTTRNRKIFHLIFIPIFIIGLLYECKLLYFSTVIALALLIFLEALRVCQIDEDLSRTLDSVVNTFKDDKDSGKIVLTPIYLLIGCSLPIWISAVPCQVTDTTGAENLIPLLSGVISVGIGDAAASYFGSKFGRIKWPNTQKSVEGTVANILAQTATVCLLCYSNLAVLNGLSKFTVPLAIISTSLLEANTDQIDNLVLPLVFYILSASGRAFENFLTYW